MAIDPGLLRLVLFSVLIGSAQALAQQTDNRPEDANRPNAESATTQQPSVLERLKASLLNDPSLGGIDLTAAELPGDGSVRVTGSLRWETQRALVETQGIKVLKREVEVGNLTGDFQRVDASEMVVIPIGPDRRDAAERLRANLLNDPSLEGIQIVGTDVLPVGLVEVRGLLTDQSQRLLVEKQGLKALRREVEVGNLTGPVARVDASKMIMAPGKDASPVDYVRVIEKLLPATPGNAVRVRSRGAAGGEVILCGVVPSEDDRQQLQTALSHLRFTASVNVEPVMVVDRAPSADVSFLLYRDALLGLKRRNSGEIIEPATRIIRKGDGKAAVWYLKAAGHLLAGERSTAVGDVRIAVALEGRHALTPHSARFDVLRHFQGKPRIDLEQMISAGESLSLVP